ncbi:D-alanyl-D-alanine carboxypeptidase family protein [Nostoc spongiaeforme FACHB-130]|uniref:D-alanyl-D-alanine carboxypeptidase family protein n=1 Tax=Nostoc spongiaeforme FACHB-130 TaxID=1357510 RepID=A0ABR8G2V4_9NOSO|nr:D-alanyl-D-alanine carboxypeptidase family protein [Nostoc spongiaeforme]MBD2597575.1 D-alanyl-D-alanine carboxypeptidase family protein [Nostoc spongiaeforme FACHB-130]
MKRLIKPAKFIFTAIFICLALVASNSIQRYQSVNNLPSTNQCLVASVSGCIANAQEPNLPQPVTSEPLSPQENFVAAIMQSLKVMPAPGTYEYTLLRSYGAAFINSTSNVKLPPKLIFDNEADTQEYQSQLTLERVVDTKDCYLQKSAADALNKARLQFNIPLKSGYGASDCLRSYATNLRFWHKYANNKTLEKVKEGKETAILGVVAPPGTSQHLWGLAIDLGVSNAKQRQILNQNGWFQTVVKDVPHWTYLGVSAEDLPKLGFKKQVIQGITYWLTPLS